MPPMMTAELLAHPAVAPDSAIAAVAKAVPQATDALRRVVIFISAPDLDK